MDKPEIILDFNIPIQYKTQRASLNKPIMARHFFLLFFFGHCDQLLGHFSRKNKQNYITIHHTNIYLHI